jgi:Family of unknown function (DUF5681)
MDPNNDQRDIPPEKHEEVGYAKPPGASRFKKGVSGNPKGRPKGSLNVETVFIKSLLEKVVINENGQRKKVTKLQAALKQLANKSASGDMRAIRQTLELAHDAQAKQIGSVGESPIVDELDREVMEGILKRFRGEGVSEENKSREPREADDVDNQHG